MGLGNAYPSDEVLTMDIKGRDPSPECRATLTVSSDGDPRRARRAGPRHVESGEGDAGATPFRAGGRHRDRWIVLAGGGAPAQELDALSARGCDGGSRCSSRGSPISVVIGAGQGAGGAESSARSAALLEPGANSAGGYTSGCATELA